MEAIRSYKLTLTEKHSYVVARVTGHVNPGQDSVAYLKTIAEHCVRHGCPAILIDKDTPEPFAIWDTFAMASRLATVAAPSIKIAVVNNAPDLPGEPPLSIMVGSNRGMDVHMFTNTPDAKHWLLTGTLPAAGH